MVPISRNLDLSLKHENARDPLWWRAFEWVSRGFNVRVAPAYLVCRSIHRHRAVRP